MGPEFSEPQVEDRTEHKAPSSPLVRFGQKAGKVRAEALIPAEGGSGAVRRGQSGLPKGS